MDSRHTKLAVGDWIRVEGEWGATYDRPIEEFRQCLGVFLTVKHRKAGQFTPLCNLWGRGAGSEVSYISNFGEYIKNPVALWMNIPAPKGVS